MLNNCRNAQERWGGVHQVIDRWIQERCELVKAHKALLDCTASAPVSDCVTQGYCQLLVDYVSAGHFEYYELLNAEAESLGDKRGLELAQTIYPRLEHSTTAALTFNDLCDESACSEAVLATSLQRLGTELLERFELEDCLIEVLHNAHQNQVLMAPA